MEGACQGAHGMTGVEWRVATALFTAGEVSEMVLVRGHASHVSRRIVAIQPIARFTNRETEMLQLCRPVGCRPMHAHGGLVPQHLMSLIYHTICSSSCLCQAGQLCIHCTPSC